MRVVWHLLALGAAGLWAATGCQSHKATPATAPPTPEELPHITQLERIVPARVGVEERDRGQPRVILVPKYEEPEPTPEERAVLGEQPEPFNWLEFYVPQPEVTRVWPGLGGVSTAVYGVGGGAVGVRPYQWPFSIGPGMGGVVPGVLPDRITHFGHAPRDDRPYAAPGPVGGLRVGEGPPSRYAERQRRPDP